MAPEYGATCGFFPVDNETLKYLKISGRDNETIDLVENYSKEQGLWASEDIIFSDKWHSTVQIHKYIKFITQRV